jgi:hypothetical protein
MFMLLGASFYRGLGSSFFNWISNKELFMINAKPQAGSGKCSCAAKYKEGKPQAVPKAIMKSK